MRVDILRPAGSSGFVLRPDDNRKYAVIDMGVPPGLRFLEMLERFEIELDDIGILALTHLHTDHVDSEGIRALLDRTNCSFVLSEWIWDKWDNTDPKLKGIRDRLKDSNRLRLLSETGNDTVADWRISWWATTHISGNEIHPLANTSYRFDDVVISGDCPIRDLLSLQNTKHFSTDPATGPVTALIVNTSHVSEEDMATQDYPDHRKHKWRNCHGLLSDLLAAMHVPEYNEFFSNLQWIIHTHFRRKPHAESRILIQQMIEQVRDELGFGFNVKYE